MSALNAILKAIKRLDPTKVDPAMQRAELLSQKIDLSRYAPSNIARTTTFTPPAQRGFSESMLPFYPNIGATLIRPSEWAERTPPLNFLDDERTIQKLQRSLMEKKLKESPSAILTEYPDKIDVGHEGRHRMEALRRLYGDDPVLVNIALGNKYDYIRPGHMLYKPGTDWVDYKGPSGLSPLELMRREIVFGEGSWDPNPLWIKE